MINLKHSQDFSNVKGLLAECMWVDEQRINEEITKYKEDENRELYGTVLGENVVGIIGLTRLSGGEVELKHIAVKEAYRGNGIGSRMIKEYANNRDILKITAETDKKAVGFYRKLGFTISSLGEKYPGVERFACSFENLQR